MSWPWAPLGLISLLLATGCGEGQPWAGPQYALSPPAAQADPIYRLAVHPLYNPQKMAQDYQPLIDYLNGQLGGARFQLESSRDYATFENKYRSRQPQFIQPNPWQTLDAMKYGYLVLAMAGEPGDFRGIILVRKDSGIARLQDLRGRTVAYPAPTALAACMLPQFYFLEHGLNPMKDLENRYVGTQESVILNVFMGSAAAGCTWPPPWRAFQKEHPREAAELRVAWETPALVNNALMARQDVPQGLRNQVRALMVNLQNSPQGLEILKNMETVRYTQASAADYEGVRRFVDTFERRVRPAEHD